MPEVIVSLDEKQSRANVPYVWTKKVIFFEDCHHLFLHQKANATLASPDSVPKEYPFPEEPAQKSSILLHHVKMA